MKKVNPCYITKKLTPLIHLMNMDLATKVRNSVPKDVMFKALFYEHLTVTKSKILTTLRDNLIFSEFKMQNNDTIRDEKCIFISNVRDIVKKDTKISNKNS